MSLSRTIRETFAAEASPAVPLAYLNRRLRALGSPSTPDGLRRELRAAPEAGLRTLDAPDPLLEDVAAACSDGIRPAGLDTLVMDVGERGLRPTPADAVRVLGRGLGPRDRRKRARWVRLLGELGEPGTTPTEPR